MILAYYFLRHARGRPEFVPLFGVLAPPWVSSAHHRRSRRLVGLAPHRTSIATKGELGKTPVAEELEMGHTTMGSEEAEGQMKVLDDNSLSIVALDDGGVIARTNWMRSPTGTEQRQYRVRHDRTGVECEIRIWRNGCRPGAWQYVGHHPGNIKDAIRKARDLRQVAESFTALYERVSSLRDT